MTIVERGPRLIKRDDEDVSETVKEILENEGVNIRLEAECISAEKRGDKVVVKLDCESGAMLKWTSPLHFRIILLFSPPAMDERESKL